MKVARSLFILTIMLIASVGAQERFAHISSQESRDGTKVTEVYLDQITQRLVVKQFRKESSTAFLKRGDTQRVAEAWYPAPVGYSLETASTFDLSQAEGQRDGQNFLRDLEGSDQGLARFNSIMNDVKEGPSRYKLIQMGKKDNNQVGVYYNDKLGEFIFQSIENKDEREHQFPLTSGLATDIEKVPGDQNPLSFKRFKMKTLYDFYQNKNAINEEMARHGFKLPESAFDDIEEQIKAYQDGFKRVHLKEESNGIFEETQYNADTNELIVRRYRYDDEGYQVVISEKIYDLNIDTDFDDAYLRFQGLGEEAKAAFNNVLISVGGCEEPLKDSAPVSVELDAQLDDMNAVLEKMWRQELDAGLPQNLKRTTTANQMVLDFKLFGRDHPLRLDVDGHGRLKDVNFVNVGLARDKQMRIRHLVDDKGQKQFMIQAFNEVTGEWENQLVLESEFVMDSNGNGVPRIAAYLKGQQEEGRFNFEGFEKSVYPLRFSNRQLTQTGPRFRFDGRRRNEFNDINYDREGKGGLINFAFQVFFSEEGKRNKVKKTIVEEARKALNSPSFSGLISNSDIESVAEEVTMATAARTDNFKHSSNRVEAVASEEAYSRFGDLALNRLVKELMPTESDHNIGEMVDSVMREFRICLKRASDARNSEMAQKCMDTFMKEAPIDVAKEILALKLTQANLGDFKEIAEKEFLACTQEHYEPIKARATSEEGMDVVKGCLYKALIVTVDKTAEGIVDDQLGEISREMGLNLSFSREKLQSTRQRVRECLADHGLGNYGARGFEVNITQLGRTPADLFEQNFMGCQNSLIEGVAKSVGEVALAAKLNEVTLSEEAKNRVMEQSFGPGLVQCLEGQNRTIRRLKNEYLIRRQQLVAETGKNDVKVDLKVPSFDPLQCNRVLTNLATGYAAQETLRDLLGEDIFINVKEEKGFDPITCFENEHRHLMESLPTWMVTDSNLNEDQKKRVGETRDQEVEAKTAACLKKAIADASFYAAQKMMLEKLRENPKYKDMDVSAEAKIAVGLSVKNCFINKLNQYEDVDSILREQEVLKDVCAAELFKDADVQKHLFTPFIEDAISKVEMSPETKERVMGMVLEKLAADLAPITSIDDAMATIEAFTPKAIPVVLEGILQEKVYDITKAQNEAEVEEADRLVKLVQREIFGEAGDGELGLALVAAIESNDEAALTKVIGDIELKAAQILGPEVLKKEAFKLVESGTLDGEEDAQSLVAKGSEVLAACLEEARSESRENAIDYCVEETTVLTTEHVLREKLDASVKDHSLIGGLLDEEDRKAIADELITEERLEELRELSKLEGAEKETRMDDFVLTFKIDATDKVFEEAISDIISDKLTAPASFTADQIKELDRQIENMGQRSAESFSSCADNIRDKMKLPDHGMTELDLDQCMNRARLQATEEILPKRLELLLKWVNSSELDREKLSGLGKAHFQSCAEKMPLKSEGNLYGHHLDGCLNVTVMSFVGDIIADLRDKKLLLSEGDDAVNWDSCVADIEKRAMNHVYGEGGTPREVSTLKGADLYRELFSQGEKNERQPDLDWLIPNIAACAFENEIGDALGEITGGFIKRNEAELSDDTKEAVVTLTETIEDISDNAAIDYSPILNWISTELATKPSEEVRANPPAPPTPVEEYVSEFEPKIVELLNGAVEYDAEALKKALIDYRESARERFKGEDKDNGEKVGLGEVGEHLAESPLMDVLLESVIAGMVKQQTTEALEEEGASTVVTKLLSSKIMINRLYGSGAGKEALDALKKEFIIPFLKGEIKELEIPKELMAKVTDVLADDTATNGFAETLFGPIIQKKLDDKKEWIESGWTAPFKYWGARIFKGINPDRDFVWGNRFDPQKHPAYLKHTPSGQRAVKYFSEELLKPMLRGELTEEREEEVTEEITALVEKAMKENDRD